MKKALTIYKLILLSVMIQCFIYFFINSVYLSNRVNLADKINYIPISSYENFGSAPTAKPKGLIIPAGADNIKISYDNAYASYILDGKLNITDIKRKENIKVIEAGFRKTDLFAAGSPKDSRIACYKWLPDKNTIMYALNSIDASNPKIQFLTYDIESAYEHSGANLTRSSIPGIPLGSEITELFISPLTMVTYGKVKINQNESRMFRIDIMDGIYSSIITANDIKAKIGYYSEIFIIQNGTNLSYIKNGARSVATPMPFKERVALLEIIGIETEGKDRVYVGELNDQNMVQKILYGNIETPVADWKAILPVKPLLPENIFIDRSGKIFNIARDINTITNITEDTRTWYAGSFVQITVNQVASLDDNELKFLKLN